ncbi:acetyl-CoA carboxylase [Parasphingorhabdus pacifica]
MSSVNAQLPGVFYRRPSPEQDPFAKEGTTVEPGQTLGLIEVMKTFSEIKADRHGRLGKVLIEDGDEVETGQVIMEIEDT